MLISKEMYLYLKDYMNWVENGAINLKPYSRRLGLCFSIEDYTEFNDRDLPIYELDSIFEAEGLNLFYPFGEDNYKTRFHNRTQHLDPIRLEWIKDHIEEYENALVTA